MWTAALPAATGDITTFADPAGEVDTPIEIASGPDGNLWFTVRENERVGRITPDGVITTFVVGGAPQDIAAGPDGALWVTQPVGTASLVRVATDGSTTAFPDAGLASPLGITAGPDGRIWFTNRADNRIGAYDIGTGTFAYYSDPGANIDSPFRITPGPDGRLWFTSQDTDRIGAITVAGVIETFPDPGIAEPLGIVTGPDGRLWFTNFQSGEIGAYSPTAGTFQYFGPAPGTTASDRIALGPDGNLWFTAEPDVVARLTPGGTITVFASAELAIPVGITTGPDCNIWVVGTDTNRIGRVEVLGSCAPAPLPLTPTFTG